MKYLMALSATFLLAVVSVAAGADPAAPALTLDNIHIRVPDQNRAKDWYLKHLGATPGDAWNHIMMGKMAIELIKADHAQPSAGCAIDNLGFSFADIDAKIAELAGDGAKVLMAARDVPGLFKVGFVEDPFGVKLELIQLSDVAGFHHVHLNAPDPQASLKWYEDMVGGQRDKLKGRIDGLRYDGFWLLAAKGATAPAPSAECALMSVGWRIRDMKEAVTAFNAKGAKTVTGPGVFGKLKYAFFDDPNGVKVQLVERD